MAASLGVVAAGLGRRLRSPSAKAAREDGVSLNQWVSSAVAQNVGSVETAAAFFKYRAEGADRAAMMRFLVDVPDLPEESSEKGTGQ